ncbi:hypothetical protein Swit_0248 [Rhizorhabdus wittichii RW1]|uniref:Secreted protein n=1 Tax=Rhizorhabdus wittichii (strain DSM 6014 / CCUG 31198 / JCM 15750 / NBRC 105917 / EY 4224 / RW1) TaxID=392499 RepID=A0A9J9LC63_RHIWR|nr:hypothetical protein Swit_0248 [Rhizorhabdus wittichii RW1]
MTFKGRSSFLLSALILVPAAGQAQSSEDVADLVGARAAGAETQMEARGYRATVSNTVRDQRFTFWWNERKGRCVSVSTIDGRYASIDAVPPGNCDAQDASRPAYGAQQAPGHDAKSLVLVCYGAGTKPTVEPSRYAWNPWNHKWEWSTPQNGAKGFSSDVQIELYGASGRIHLGKSLVPPIHSGGDNGWWDIENLAVTPDRISGSYRLNGMNKPRFTVDRRTGRIEVKAVTNFAGQCDMGDWGKGQHRF